MLQHSLNQVERYFPNQLVAKCFRMFLIYLCIYLYGISFNKFTWVGPLMLGALACSMSEVDGHWRHKLHHLIVIQITFAITLYVCNWLYSFTWLFLLWLIFLSFFLTMLAAVNQRYSLFGFSNMVILTYYCILIGSNTNASSFNWQLAQEGYLLLIGAFAYSFIALVWCWLFANQPLRQNMAQVLQDLAVLLQAKADFFQYTKENQQDANNLRLANANQKLVEDLNLTKDSIYLRITKANTTSSMQHFLGMYFIVQDIHERAVSAHYAYSDLANTFFYSDIMFRVQRTLRAQAQQCLLFSQDLRNNRKLSDLTQSVDDLQDLQHSLNYLQQQYQQVKHSDANNEQLDALAAIEAIYENLATLQNMLEKMRLGFVIKDANKSDVTRDNRLFNTEPRTLAQKIEHYKIAFTIDNVNFRHALRISSALAIGYLVMLLVNFIAGYLEHNHQQGFWIILTILFVCSSGLATTKTMVIGRVIGTVLGLLFGWIILKAFVLPSQQLAFAIVGCLLMVAFKSRSYSIATMGITIMMLMCFNQSVDSFTLIIPRFIDTLIGVAVALIVVLLVLPDWLQKSRVPTLLSKALQANSNYLTEILQQYAKGGKQDNMQYRVARRDAHNADAELSSLLSALLKEPKIAKHDIELVIRQQVNLHSILNYLSGMAVHRQQLSLSSLQEQIFALGKLINAEMQQLSKLVKGNQLQLFDLQQCPSLLKLHSIKQQFAMPLLDDEIAMLLLNQLEFILENLLAFVQITLKTKSNIEYINQ